MKRLANGLILFLVTLAISVCAGGQQPAQAVAGMFMAHATPWWLAGGIDPADVVAAFSPKGAASYAVSKVRVGGSLDAQQHNNGAAWDAATGWSFLTIDDALWIDYISDENTTIIADATGVTKDFNYMFGTSGPATYGVGYIWRYRYRHGTDNSGAGVDGHPESGVFGVSKTKGYLNGVSDRDIPAGSSYSAVSKVGVFGFGYNTGVWYSSDCIIRRIAVYNRPLTDAEQAAVAAAIIIY